MANHGDQEVVLEFPSVFDPKTCARRGMCPGTQPEGRRQREPLSLYFEVHGSGPERIIFIMGLRDNSSSWLPQVEHFSKLERYTTLVFDNRGTGLSGAPWGIYSTSGMAEDTLCLLNYLQWTEDRSLHVVGLSLGGMIAQELAYRIPSRIMSLSLVVTRAGGNLWTDMPSPRQCLSIARVLTTSDPDKQNIIFEEMLFPKEWLDSLAKDDPEGRTNREVQRQRFHRGMKITKPQTRKGSLGQLAAVVAHRMTFNRLAQVSASVPKVLILSAAEDALIPQTEGEKLKRYMPEAEYQCWEKTGHFVCCQYVERFNQLLEKVFKEGREAAGKRVDAS